MENIVVSSVSSSEISCIENSEINDFNDKEDLRQNAETLNFSQVNIRQILPEKNKSDNHKLSYFVTEKYNPSFRTNNQDPSLPTPATEIVIKFSSENRAKPKNDGNKSDFHRQSGDKTSILTSGSVFQSLELSNFVQGTINQYSIGSTSACTLICVEVTSSQFSSNLLTFFTQAALQFLLRADNSRDRTSIYDFITPSFIDKIVTIGSQYKSINHLDFETALMSFHRYESSLNSDLGSIHQESLSKVDVLFQNIYEKWRNSDFLPMSVVLICPPETVVLFIYRSYLSSSDYEVLFFDSHPRPPKFESAHVIRFKDIFEAKNYASILFQRFAFEDHNDSVEANFIFLHKVLQFSASQTNDLIQIKKDAKCENSCLDVTLDDLLFSKEIEILMIKQDLGSKISELKEQLRSMKSMNIELKRNLDELKADFTNVVERKNDFNRYQPSDNEIIAMLKSKLAHLESRDDEFSISKREIINENKSLKIELSQLKVENESLKDILESIVAVSRSKDSDEDRVSKGKDKEIIKVIEEYKCPICMESRNSRNDSFYIQPCLHVFCLECFQDHVSSAIVNRIFPIKCPLCSIEISQLQIEMACSEMEWVSYMQLEVDFGLAGIPGIINCRKPNCNYRFEAYEDVTRCECLDCQTTWCQKCDVVPYHTGKSCEMFKIDAHKESDEYKKADAATEDLIRKANDMTHCPNCNVPIFKVVKKPTR
ncbi:hypothetical protein HK096_005485 [Nowakowskiella sp. JEL0078]|nr:hypothetical protein HK096_005485 [Nowakowskiella sp. JEL0078]